MFYAPEVVMVVAATPLENHCSIIVNNDVADSVLFLFRCTLRRENWRCSTYDAIFVYIIILPKHLITRVQRMTAFHVTGLSSVATKKNTCSFLD